MLSNELEELHEVARYVYGGLIEESRVLLGVGIASILHKGPAYYILH